MVRPIACVLLVAALGACAGRSTTAERPSTTSTSARSAGTTSTTAPAAADDPAGLARQIATAEHAIRSDATAPDTVVEMAHLQQVAYRKLARNPDWMSTVLATVGLDLAGAVRDNVRAATELRMLVEPKDTVPPWRIVAPAPADELLRAYRDAGSAFGIGWQYLAAVHLVETRMGRIRGTSSAGAQGPMQFLPATWAKYGRGDINDNRDAIFAAANYLHANGAPGDIDNALFHYNHSPHYVNAVRAYAGQMAADPRTYRGYHEWQVYYLTTVGDLLLPVGYAQSAPVPAAEYARTL